MPPPAPPTAAPPSSPKSAPACPRPHASVSPKFLYDALGSRLFEAICELPEYYPTRTEAAIFARHGAEIARAVGARHHPDRPGRRQLRQGGPPVPAAASGPVRGDRHLGRLPARVAGTPAAALPATSRCGRWAWIFPAASRCRPRVRAEKRLFFYPGSSIGNFTPDEARRLPAPRARPVRPRRRPPDRHRPGQGPAPCWTPPTTMRWASPPPST